MYGSVAAALSVGAALGALLLASSPTGYSSNAWPFATVTPAQLAPAGVTLSDPTSSLNGAVSLSSAESAASAAFGASVREIHAMHCVDTTAVPNIDQDCYVVSVDPSKVPLMSSSVMPAPDPPVWAIVLVDPSTGKVIESRAGNR